MDEKVLGILAKGGKAMTNYEAMQLMDKDELAEFLSGIVDCKKCPALEKFCDLGQRECVDAILNWLNAESDDDTVVAHIVFFD